MTRTEKGKGGVNGKGSSREGDLSQSLSVNDFTACQAADGDF